LYSEIEKLDPMFGFYEEAQADNAAFCPKSRILITAKGV
jgi:hypothetical protein